MPKNCRRFCGHSSHSGICIIARLRARNRREMDGDTARYGRFGVFMPGIARLLLALACGGSVWLVQNPARADFPEWNPVRSHAVQLGREAHRLVVGFRATAGNTVVKAVKPRMRAQSVKIIQAQTSDADVAALAQRTGLAMARSRQMTPSM